MSRRTLELFCGTKSFSNVAQSLGLQTFTSDIDEDFKPDYAVDIMDFNKKRVTFKPDILWASPPCESFSVASIGKHWGGGHRAYIPKSTQAKQAIKMLEKMIDVIAGLRPKIWYIENTRGVMRKILPRLLDEKIGNYWILRTVTYCQYGDSRMKPTDIFTNDFSWTPRQVCKNGDSCHEAAPRGSKTGTQGIRTYKDRSRVPAELIKELLTPAKKGVNK